MTHIQAERWRAYAWLGVLGIGAVAYLLVLRTLVATNNLNLVPSLLLLGSLVVPASVLVFAATRRHQSVPASILAFTAFAGGVIGTVCAGILEYHVLEDLGTLPMLAVGLIEESAKLVVPVSVLVLVRSVWQAGAGIIVGVASGMGFASLETMGYGLQALLKTGSITDVDQTLLLRGLVSPACHVAWTGLICFAIARARFAPSRVRAGLVAAGVFVVVVVLHAGWDGTSNVLVHAGVGLVSVTAALVAVGTLDVDREPAAATPAISKPAV